ncbi:unnamed protein product [Penicillium salamii]|uniref:PLC-like phosphodiesterase n=1 Tax=Penicillium salamii TaxID=1612424 RepID=A0A9W4K3K0_9EURO|nr:unnamed protein product [Penicillium salamii]CAG7950972.1 unnamed protein product [Penicillium salamii]CAG8243165.1 unnamed protein product [Penicillium salamii]CAG8296971.1 unnamed protein product [Penicillium salamii]CAG8335480.1 unnamed protein product [Penicillium salamii]
MACRRGVTRAVLSVIFLLQPVLAVSGTTTLVSRTSSSPVSAPSDFRSSSTPSTCNGHSEYRTRSYSNITFVGSHDSPFVGPLPQQNQNIDIKAQLDMGIRYLQAQTHHSVLDKKTLELCHTSCFLEDAGTLKKFLTTIKKWLDAHPNEVVTLLLTNGDSISISEFGDTFSSSGITKYAYVPPSSPLAISDWPTMGDLISSGKRLVVFLDYGANTSQVSYIHDEFAYYFETAYDVTDASFSSCSIDRPPGASATGRMGLVNHFLDIDIFGVKVPARDKAGTTNAASGKGSIGAQASLCAGLYGRVPNVILADFVDKGEVIKAQNNLNGL